MEQQRIDISDIRYPCLISQHLANAAPTALFVTGNVSILQNRLLALICSVQCPGSIVIQTFDAMRALRDTGIVVVGGFHSPMERECLDILLRGTQPIIICPAKRLCGLRLGTEGRKALKNGRLLVITPFGNKVKRTTSAQATMRNEMVAAMADVVLVPHAAPGGKTEALAKSVLARRQRFLTFDDENNINLNNAGAEPFFVDKIPSYKEKS